MIKQRNKTNIQVKEKGFSFKKLVSLVIKSQYLIQSYIMYKDEILLH